MLEVIVHSPPFAKGGLLSQVDFDAATFRYLTYIFYTKYILYVVTYNIFLKAGFWRKCKGRWEDF